MTWWIWTLIVLGALLLLFIYRIIIVYTVIQSIESEYSNIIPEYYYKLDLKALEDAMAASDKQDQLQYHILKLTAANIDFIEKLDDICQQYNFIAEINQKFSDKVSEIILTPKDLINVEES